MTTVQLRRYELYPEVVDQFLAWFDDVLAVRAEFGFKVEFAYLNRESSEFTWAVSHEADFDAVEADYLASPGRANLSQGIPSWFSAAHIAKVDVIK